MNTSVREIRVSSDPDSIYFLRVDWEGLGLGSGFQVLLTDGQKAWTGAVSEKEVRSEADELEMQTEHYVSDLKEALMGAGSSAHYSFTLTPQQEGVVMLAYEKKQKNISFRLGCVSLSVLSEPLDAVRTLLRHNLTRANELKLQNQNLMEQNQRLSGEQERIAKQLKSYATAKETLEEELFSRFVVVLNEKKAKLRSLQETVTHLEDRNKQKHKDSSRSPQTADQDDDYGGSTDEEPSTTSDLPAQETASPSSPQIDSLSDITDVAPSRKRRFRQLEAPGPSGTRGGRPETSHTHSVSPAGRSTETAAPSSVEDLFDDL
ncbi:unnamed protein product [Ophioblennius macclurei]